MFGKSLGPLVRTLLSGGYPYCFECWYCTATDEERAIAHEAELEDMGTWRGWADEEPDEQQLTDESLALGSPSNTASTSTSGGADEAGSEDSELEGVLAQTVALSRLRRQMSEDSGMADLAPEVQDEIAQLSSDLGRSLSPQQAQVLPH